MCPTSAPTQMNLVDVHGYNVQSTSQSSENVNFAELLVPTNSNQLTTPIYLDTYLKPLDSSTGLVASQKMLDYVIDINIYRFVLKLYLLKQRLLQLNKYNFYINYIKPLSKPRIRTEPLKYKCTSLLYNSPMIEAVGLVLNIKYNDSFLIFRNLCSSSTEFLEIFDEFDLITSMKFNEYVYYTTRCQKCTFVHAPINTDNAYEIRQKIKSTYKLLTNNQIDYIIDLCSIKTYLSL